MKKLLSFAAIMVAIVVSSCSFDDTSIWDKLNDHEERIAKLEELCNAMNADIESLKTIVSALEKNVYVTKITETQDGYTISFSDNKTITIKNGKDGQNGANGNDGADGKDGQDGQTPVIGVAEEDGVYYWTVNGEWLLDANGNKVKASGTDGKDGASGNDGATGATGNDGKDGKDGKDGVTPKLKIENDAWWVSYDEGATWEELGTVAEGTVPVADSIFTAVEEKENHVEFTLKDGTIIKVAKAVEFDLVFTGLDQIIAAGKTYEVGYTATTSAEAIEIEAFASKNIADVEVVATDGKNGVIKFTTGENNENSKVVVLATDGYKVVMRGIVLEAAAMKVEENAPIEVAAEGNDNVELAFFANFDEFEVVIPEGIDWITLPEATRAMEEKKVALAVAMNPTTDERSAVVSIKSAEYAHLTIDYTIVQAGQALPLLATPVVSATVEENTVTLAWEAVENAGLYSISVGTEMPVFTEELSYTFTGEYETEYTFSVVAIPADEEVYAASEAAVVTATTEVENTVQIVTVAEFLAAAEDTTMYQLTGIITSVTNTTYGNFYLKDATGEVLIYGLCSPEGAQKYWAESGAKVGDTITVQTVRTSFNGAPQGKNALFVELVPFVAEATEWGVVGVHNNWGNTPDTVMYTTWKAEKLYVAYNVELSDAFKIRANNQWNDAKNYGLETPGNLYADKYYTLINGAGSQNATPMEAGTYDVYFDLANERIALVTPGKEYADAVDGGNPVVIIAGLKNHAWGLVGSFNGWDVANYVEATVDGDWAVVENVELTTNAEFKFAADKAWTLSYGSACDVNVDTVYTTYNNGGNMKFVGEAGAYNFYFSLITAEFYMEKWINPDDVAEMVLTFPGNPSAYTNAYTATFSITLEDTYTFEFSNFNNGQESSNWDAIRMGRKSNASVASVVNKVAMPYAVSAVKVNFTQVDTEMNSAKLIVATDEAFENIVEEVTATLAVGEVAYNITTPATNLYYKLEYDMPATGANGSYRINKITYAK